MSPVVSAATTSVREKFYRSDGNQNDDIEVGPGNLKLVYSGSDGKLTGYINGKNMVNIFLLCNISAPYADYTMKAHLNRGQAFSLLASLYFPLSPFYKPS